MYIFRDYILNANTSAQLELEFAAFLIDCINASKYLVLQQLNQRIEWWMLSYRAYSIIVGHKFQSKWLNAIIMEHLLYLVA